MRLVICQLLILLSLLSCSDDDNNSNRVNIPQEEQLSREILTDRTDVIWGFDFLPDNQIIFTERSGNIAILNTVTKEVANVTGAPSVSTGGEGGLLDLKLHPDFSSNNLVYFCFTAPGRRTALARGTLADNSLTNIETLFQTVDANSSSIHFGCRIIFENNSRLYLTIGDQSEPSKAQDLSSHLGKILRLNEDGSYPADNPFVTTANARPEIWTIGHRNPQGLAIEPETNELYSSEHGPTGGDELNVIIGGRNYGWPDVTHGQSAPGLEDPILVWTPAIAPSGITFYSGNLFIATLRGNHIRRIDIKANTQTLLFENTNRYRNVTTGPDGLLYFSTDDGKIGRLTSAP